MNEHIRKCFTFCLALIFVFGGLAASKAFASEEEMWKQFAGLELNFLTEDTPAAGAIVELLPQFQEKTGIKVNVTRTNIADLVTKLAPAPATSTLYTLPGGRFLRAGAMRLPT